MYFGNDRPNSRLVRERIYGADPDDVYFRIKGETVKATRDTDVSIVHEGNGTYPPCPDCGGEIVWKRGGPSARHQDVRRLQERVLRLRLWGRQPYP